MRQKRENSYRKHKNHCPEENTPGDDDGLKAQGVDFYDAERIKSPGNSCQKGKEIALWVQVKIDDSVKADQGNSDNGKQKADVEKRREMLFFEENLQENRREHGADRNDDADI